MRISPEFPPEIVAVSSLTLQRFKFISNYDELASLPPFLRDIIISLGIAECKSLILHHNSENYKCP